MSLPDRDALKLRLRIESDVEDADLDLMLASALGTIEQYVKRPIVATERTVVIESRDEWITPTRLFLPLYPVDVATVEITDADDAAITDIRVNGMTGLVTSTGSGFSNFPYTVTADVGLSLMDDYATRVEPILAQALLDLCADWYQRRNPAALAEGAGGGVMTQWMGQGMGGMESPGIPMRITQMLQPFRLAKAL